VFEAKGGGSTLGGKKVESINPVTFDRHFAEQGSREYLEKTIQDMAKSSNESNQRFIDFAITTIEFHQDNESCPCALFIKKYKLTNDVVKREIQYEGFDPNKEAKKGNIKIVDTAYIDNNWVDYYMVECAKCATHYKVEEREGHFMFWRWLKI
jgi:hypothetical protein